MSIYAEYKHGMMSYDEFVRAANEEARLDELLSEEEYEDEDEDEDEEVFIDDDIDEF